MDCVPGTQFESSLLHHPLCAACVSRLYYESGRDLKALAPWVLGLRVSGAALAVVSSSPPRPSPPPRIRPGPEAGDRFDSVMETGSQRHWSAIYEAWKRDARKALCSGGG